MDKIVRISSVQGEHDFSGNKNLVDYHIPANSGIYNLRESYVAVNVNNTLFNDAANNCIGHTRADDDHARIVFCLYREGAERVTGASFIVPPTTAVLIKNAQMISSTKGQIESLRRVDILRANQYSYVKTKANLSSNMNGILLATEDGSNTCESRQPYMEAVNIDPSSDSVNTGSPVRSIYRNHEIRIPLREVFNFCQGVEMYDSAVYGSTHINFEFQFEKLIAAQSNTNLANTDYRASSGEFKLGAMEDNTPSAAGGYANVNRMMTKNTFGLDGVQLSPFYHGQKIKINNGGSVAGKITTITSIVVYDGAGAIKMSPTNTVPFNSDLAIAANKGKLLIEVDGSYLDAQAQAAACNNLVVTTHDLGGTDTVTLSIENVDLVCKIDKSGQAAPKQIEYTRFDTEEDSFSIVQDAPLNRYYDIPANCDSVWLLLTGNQTYALVDTDQQIEKYRITIDNVELSNRDIEQHSQLHKDLIAKCLRNQGLPLNSLDEEFQTWNHTEGVQGGVLKSNIIGFPVPLKAQPQKLGIEIIPATGKTLRGFLNIYKHRMAVV